MKTIFAATIAAFLLLAGCATPKVPDNGELITTTTKKNGNVVKQEARSGYALQAQATLALQAQQKPIFEMEALDGQTIELKGVKRLAVYSPGSTNQGASLPAPMRELSGWEKALAAGDRVFERGLQVLGLVYNKQGLIAQVNANRDVQLGQQRATVDLADTVGARNAQIAGLIQAPGPVTTTTTNYSLTGSFLTQGNNSPLTHSSNNPTRTCTGGTGAGSGAGGGTTTGDGASSGGGGAGGSATC